MNNSINTDEEVMEWARMIVAGGGNKYTPLGKGDQFVIAKHILGMVSGIASLAKQVDKAEVPAPTHPDENNAMNSTKDAPVETMKVQVSRGHYLHTKGYDPQKAYDMFLEWGKAHPKELTVMDFSSGVKSNIASFAFWLAESIPVEMPVTTTIETKA